MLNFLFGPLADLFGGNIAIMGALGICFVIASIVLIAAHIRRKGLDVERRVLADTNGASRRPPGLGESIKSLGEAALTTIAGQTGSEQQGEDARVLRAKLVQAGYSSPKAVMLFFGARAVAALALAVLAFFSTSVFEVSGFVFRSAITFASAALGYMAPSVLLERKLEYCRDEHRRGFPDFMDLMVVCSQAGLSMEAGMQRIAMEMRGSHPSLTSHIDIALLEIRGGRPMSQAIESMSKRLGIVEARSFATLLHQTEELGSSLTQSLRAYSDDMRNKRMMQAEEKAYALPAKLVVPLTLFVFPVLMVVLMLPVVISVSRSGF